MAQVRAEDRDTVASVTYQLVRGDVTRYGGWRFSVSQY